MRRMMMLAAMMFGIGLLGAQGACGQQVDLTPLQNQIAEIQKQVQDLSSKVEGLQVVEGEGGEKVVAVDTKPLEEKIAKLEKKVSTLEQQVSSLSAKLDRVEKAVKSLAK